MSLIPATILTGFLGAGKTTLLRRILSEAHGERIAVIENEFGPESIDSELLFKDAKERIVEMNNGCLCCTVRGDLVDMLGRLAKRRAKGQLQFDRVIIETTGLAEPGPVAQTFFIEDSVAEHYMLDAIITVVDAQHAPQQLDAHAEARAQVGFADRLLISKADLVSAESVDALRQRLVAMNPKAPIQSVHFGEADLKELLDIRGFNLNAVLEVDPDFLDENAHSHNDDVSAMLFKSDRPFDGDRFEGFMSAVAQTFGEKLLRYKGVVWLDGNDHQMVFQGVHMLVGGDQGRAWEPGEVRQSRVVFIGRDLPRETLTKGLEQCLL